MIRSLPSITTTVSSDREIGLYHAWSPDAWTSRALGRKFLHFSNKDRKSTRLNSSHSQISYAVFCLKKKVAHRYTYSPRSDELSRIVLTCETVRGLLLRSACGSPPRLTLLYAIGSEPLLGRAPPALC